MGKNLKKFLNSTKRAIPVMVLLALYMVVAQLVTGTSCVFRSTVGVPCPGCGLTRAWECFFSLHIGEAFYYHPLFWYAPLFIACYIFKRIKYGSGQVKWFSVFLFASAALFISVFFIRMIFLFPGSEPLTVNHNSFLLRTVDFIKKLIS